MIGSLYSGLSGLRTHQTKINVIANNLANINTIAFKKSRAIFKENFSQMLKGATAPTGSRGGVNPSQIGVGSSVGTIDRLQTNGAAQTTGIPTDLLIRGKGLFVLEVPTGGSTQATEVQTRAIRSASIRVFTRSGNFGIDTNGDLIYKPNGFRVLGWLADPETGGVDTSNVDAIQPITFPFTRSISKKTSFIHYAANLDARSGASQVATDGGTGILSSIVPPQGGYIQPGTHTVRIERGDSDTGFIASLDSDAFVPITLLEDGRGVATFVNEDGLEIITAYYDVEAMNPGTATLDFISKFHQTTISAYDALGRQHDLEITLTKQKLRSDGTEYPPGSWEWEITGLTEATLVGSSSGVISFDPDTGFYSNGEPTFAEVTLKPDGDAGEFTVYLDFNDLTQFAEGSDAYADRQDGVAPGQLTSFTIGPSGLIDGIFSNGINRAIAQLALADIPNQEGMAVVSDTMMSTSPASGTPAYVPAGGRGMGEVTAGALEMSNVDLTEEFTDLITTERGFQANSRVISTSDAILQEALNLKR